MTSLAASWSIAVHLSLVLGVLLSRHMSVAAQIETEPLILKLPAPTLKGTPEDLPEGPGIEPLSGKPRPVYLIAKGSKNVAVGKLVTASSTSFTGDLAQLTDGLKEAYDRDVLEMKRGTQWVQIDLGRVCAVQAIVLWHDHRYIQVRHDVVIQMSNDPEFKEAVITIFNNDQDNSSGLGEGAEREYFETSEGKIVNAKGAAGRYIRCHGRGSSLGALNCWQEIEVYALPAD